VLLAAVVAFAVVTTALNALAASNLADSTWDLGLYQQALWSGAHHGPFYESADFETGGFGSFLQVHSAVVLVALAPAYGAIPSPVLLFAVQGALVALAAVPLFFLARSVTGAPTASLAVAGLYLVWAPTVGGALDQFHIEAFVPIGLFTLAFLVHTRRYLWAVPVALVAFLTMEVVPVFAFFLALFLLSERWSRRWAATPGAGAGRQWGARARSMLADCGAVPLWILLVGSLVAYYALLGLRTQGLATWFGFPPFPTTPVHYVIGADPTSLGLSPGNLGSEFFVKLTYWIIVLALVGFLPLLAPRALLLIAPWFAFTFLMPITTFVTFGFQYGLLLAGPLFIAVAYGARALLVGRGDAAAVRSPRSVRDGLTTSRGRRLVVAFALLVLVNLLASPLSPWSGPSGSDAYDVAYAPAPGSLNVHALAALVPPGASIVASDGLFPLVANDLNAYSLFWHTNPYLALPFGPSHLPDFVFLSEDKLYVVPPWLAGSVYDASYYGVRGVAWASPLGGVVLFQLGYAGPTTVLGPTPSTTQWLAPDRFVPAPTVVFAPDPLARSGFALTTTSAAGGLIWSGPGVDLPVGHYLVVLWLRAFATVPGTTIAPTLNAFSSIGSAFGLAPWYAQHVRFGALNSTVYVPLVFPIQVVAPVLNAQFTGTAMNADVGISFGGADVIALAG